MDSSTNINNLLYGNTIFVPSYQRAYSWDTEFDTNSKPRQVNVFLSDLEDYIRSETNSKYYFGHFIFEERTAKSFGVIDGQQRLTTIVIFLSCLFQELKKRNEFYEDDDYIFKSVIKLGSNYHFKTVDYDNQLFDDYVIDHIKEDSRGLETESQKRIIKAYCYFNTQLESMNSEKLRLLLNAVIDAKCTTHTVQSESEAIQMFIFQNNRGKKPSNLEIIKAQFMYNIHLYGGDDLKDLVDEVKRRFEKIYRYISSIEYKVNEDDVLVYTQRVFFNSLWESNAIEKVNEELSKDTRLEFIKDFTRALAVSFEYISTFLGEDERNDIDIHSVAILRSYGVVLPFVIKAFRSNVSSSDMSLMCRAFESIIVRHRVIGTRADLTSRLNDVFQTFDGDVNLVVNRINWMKNQDGWWGYWNNNEFYRCLQGAIDRELAKYLLWKYENYLISDRNQKPGYSAIRYDHISKPHLEHIAPQTPTNGAPIEAGYCEYDEEFKNQLLDCLGNYLLLSAPHNESIGNIPFRLKRATYTQLKQQYEIRDMTENDEKWGKSQIMKRKDIIVKFIMEQF